MKFGVALPQVTFPFAVIFTAFLFGFIPGAIPFGLLAGRLKRIDIRQYGSGNIGSTNVMRVLGWQFGLPVLALDAAKGFLPVLFLAPLLQAMADGPFELLLMQNVFGAGFELLRVLCGLGAILGHVFSPLLRFRGGKGVATTAGVVLALTPKAFLLCLALFMIILLVTRYLSLASMCSAVALPPLTLLLAHGHWVVFTFTMVIALLLLVRHVSNIRRLAAGTENRFVWRSSGQALPK